MVVCCVDKCTSNSKDAKTTKGLSFYMFPADPKRSQEWLSILPIKGVDYKNAVVCSLHFKPDQFSYFRPNRLVYNAVPFYNRNEKMQNDKKANVLVKSTQAEQKKLINCKLCNKNFANEERLRQHEVTHKKIVVVELPNESDSSENKVTSVYHCVSCNVGFESFQHMRMHFEFVHSSKGNKDSTKGVPRCLICQERVKSLLLHVCMKETQSIPLGRTCSICGNNFKNINMFDNHIRIHNADVENYYFPTYSEFKCWKEDLERMCGVGYPDVQLYLDQKICHCKSQIFTQNPPDGAKSIAFMCPSAIVAKEYSSGIQVTYYKEHSSLCASKEAPTIYSKYNITHLLEPVKLNPVLSPTQNQYAHLRKFIENIIVESAKLNSSGLKTLMGKMLELTPILTHDEREPDKLRSLSDEQISETINRKRSLDSDVCIANMENSKQSKLDDVPKIVNAFSLAEVKGYTDSDGESNDIDKEILNTNKSVKNNLKGRITDINTGDDSQEPKEKKDTVTFNDSYKDFVTKSFNKTDSTKANQGNNYSVFPVANRKKKESDSKKTDKELNSPNRFSSWRTYKQNNAKDAYYTKFNHRKNKKAENITKVMNDKASPIIASVKSLENDISLEHNEINTDLHSEVVIKDEVSSDTDFAEESDVQIKSEDEFIKFNISDTEVSDKNVNVNEDTDSGDGVSKSVKVYNKNAKSVKKKFKTRIGQYNPDKSIKVEKKAESTLDVSVKKDLDYEVIEQDTDCNILILKL